MKKFIPSFLYIPIICFSVTTNSCFSSPVTAISSEYKSSSDTTVKNSSMEYISVFDRNGNRKKFSRIVLGTDHLLQSKWTDDRHKAMSYKNFNDLLDEAVKLGINVFDSSPIYVGDVEYNFGKWLKSRNSEITKDSFYYNKNLNPDRNVYTISKGGFPFDLYNSKKLDVGTHSKELLDSLIENNILDRNLIKLKNEPLELKNVPSGTYSSRLYGNKEQITSRVSEELNYILGNTSRLTIFLMHRDDSDYIKFNEVRRKQTPVKDILEVLGDPKIKSKYWMIGLSNWKTQRINESVSLANKYTNLPKPLINSPYFSLFEMTSRSIHAGGVQVNHKEMMDKNFQKGIKIMPYSPLGGFSILDKLQPVWENAKKEAKKKYDDGEPYWQNVYKAIFTQENKDRYYRVVDFTKKFNEKNKTIYTVDQMINAYALAHTRTDFLTVGPITVEQLRRTVGSLKLSNLITDKDLEYLYSGK